MRRAPAVVADAGAGVGAGAALAPGTAAACVLYYDCLFRTYVCTNPAVSGAGRFNVKARRCGIRQSYLDSAVRGDSAGGRGLPNGAPRGNLRTTRECRAAPVPAPRARDWVPTVCVDVPVAGTGAVGARGGGEGNPRGGPDDARARIRLVPAPRYQGGPVAIPPPHFPHGGAANPAPPRHCVIQPTISTMACGGGGRAAV